MAVSYMGPLSGIRPSLSLSQDEPFEIGSFATSCVAAGVDILKIWGEVCKSFKTVAANQKDIGEYDKVGYAIEAVVLKHQTEAEGQSKRIKRSI
jgi:hypothetical protein